MLAIAEQFAASDTGRQRRANEDSMFVRAPLFVVADGMGGAQAGEVASGVAVDAFREASTQRDRRRPGDGASGDRLRRERADPRPRSAEPRPGGHGHDANRRLRR